MKAKHAPGPWRIVRSADYTDDPGDTQIMSVEAVDGATILFTDSGYFKPREADARLIAAAPDLLTALEAIRARINGEFDNPALVVSGPLRADTTADCLDIAVAAIAKAKGGQ